VAERLDDALGLGHIFTLIADSLDQHRPGFYQAAIDNGNVHRRVALAARELWDGRGAHLGQRLGRAASRPLVARAMSPAIPDPPSAEDLVANGDCLSGWLREVEDGLAGEPNPFSNPGPWTLALRAALPGVVDIYAASEDSKRAAMRLSFSRFRHALHTLSGVVAGELAAIDSADSQGALRRGLMAESLLDMGTDWRDELLVLRHARDTAASAGLPFAERAEDAAAASSPRTATFLRAFLAEGG
jgi:hypothetical protein